MSGTEDISRDFHQEETVGIAESEKPKDEYMFIGHEDVFAKEFKNMRKEFHSQMAKLRQEVQLQWDIFKRLIQMLIPFAVTWVVFMFCKMWDSEVVDRFVGTFGLGTFVYMVLFDLKPLADMATDLASLKAEKIFVESSMGTSEQTTDGEHADIGAASGADDENLVADDSAY